MSDGILDEPLEYFLTYTNPAAGRDREFNDWFDNIHLPDMLAVPGIVSARRFRVLPGAPGDELTHAYAALYEIRGDSSTAYAEFNRRAQSGEIRLTSDAAPGSLRVRWVPLGSG